MAINLLNEVTSVIGTDTLAGLGGAVGESPDVVRRGAHAGIPAILGGLTTMGDTPGGASRVLALVRSNQYDSPDALPRIASSFGRGGVTGEPLAREGSGILGSIFGTRTDEVAGALAGRSGMSGRSMGGLLAMLAPLVMGVLGKTVREQRLDANGLSSLLGQQRSYLGGLVPDEVSRTYAVSGPQVYERPVAGPVATETVRTQRVVTEEPHRKRPTWLVPLLVLGALLLGLFFLFRGRGEERRAAMAPVPVEREARVAEREPPAKPEPAETATPTPPPAREPAGKPEATPAPLVAPTPETEQPAPEGEPAMEPQGQQQQATVGGAPAGMAPQERAAADQAAMEEQAAADQAAMEQDQAAADQAAMEQDAAEQAAMEEQAAADQAAMEQDQFAADQAAMEEEQAAAEPTQPAPSEETLVEAPRGGLDAFASAFDEASGEQLPARYTIDGLDFSTSEADLPSDTEAIDRIAEMLEANPSARVRVEGHTDSTGDPGFNDALSQMRAVSVRDALVERGIARDRIEAQGYGASRPIASNDTEEGRQENRRSEIVLLSR
ncbi:DUF937 domain-containing protein [Sandaracinus amylolyticus]|uniref:DUF937 domain-containing protein n=1 Tax=Sandaracinus amylolyticus TaxID=927083 RepID=UPI001F1C174D|nr:DUF937 domain-containing protein [Sandaracinus amylolyticus]UJR86022.1 Hypothetical protein I5071_81030 [Sandaracinus amylolyticus]